MKKTFTGNTRLFLCISGAIIVVALIMQIAGVGLNLGIDFTGGSIQLTKFDKIVVFGLDFVEDIC